MTVGAAIVLAVADSAVASDIRRVAAFGGVWSRRSPPKFAPAARVGGSRPGFCD